MNKKLLGFYDYTVVLTYCGLIAAMAGILKIINGDFAWAIIFLMIAGVCDMFDGLVASTKKRTDSEKRFGIQIDSLCDLISFGVFPALFMYCFMDKNSVVSVFAIFYALCALIRLAYFNVLEEDRQKTTEEARKEYLGIPVTMSALLLPATYILFGYGIIGKLVVPVILTITAVGFLVPLKLKKPALIGKIILASIGLIELVLILILICRGMV